MPKLALGSALPFAMLAAVAAAGCNTTGNRGTSRVLDDAGNGTGSQGFPVNSTDDLNVVATINVGGDWMCTGFGSLWEPSGDNIVRVDPTQHAVVATIPAAGNFCYASPTENIMWVAAAYTGNVYRIDATSNTVTSTYQVAIASTSEGGFAVTDDGVWVITSDGGTNAGTLTRLDPNDGHVLADITVADDSHGIAAAGGFVWVTSFSGNTVTQVDASSNTVIKAIPVDAGPRFIAAGEGGVWALSQGTGTVAHIDPTSGNLVAVINAYAPGSGGDIAAGNGSVWVATFGKPLTRIDPTTNKVLGAWQGGGFGDAVRADNGYVWISGPHLSQIQFTSP